MIPRAPSRYAYAYAHPLLAPLVLPLIHPITASSAPPTLSMDTPPPIAQCAAGTFTWQGGRPPYTLSVRNSHSGTPVFSNSGLTDTIFHWVAAVAAGTDLVVELADTGVSGAGGGRLEDNFVVEEGSDACLSNGGTSSSTSGQAGNTSASPPSTSTSASGGQPTASETVAPSPSDSPSPSPSGSTTSATTETSVSLFSTSGAPSQTLTATGSAGSASSPPTTAGGSSIGLTTTSTSGRSLSPSPSPSTSGTLSSVRAGAGTIAGAAVGSLVAGFVLAAGLFCVWRARRARRDTRRGQWARERRGRLEPYECPSADPAYTHPAVSTTTPPPPDTDDGSALDSERGPHHHRRHRHLNAGPVVHERQGPGKDRWDGSVLPSMMQPTTSQRVDLTILHGAECSRVMDADGAEGSQGIRTDDVVRRRWDLGDLDIEDALRLGFDPADYSEHSASTAPPPYSQIA